MNLAEKTIVILGHKGMLGQMITAYFGQSKGNSNYRYSL